MDQDSLRGEPAIGYAEFGRWYDAHRTDILEPALASASEQFDAALQALLSERDRARIRHRTGRVKSKRRTWRKLRQAENRLHAETVDDIPVVVHDLIGLRVTCTNLRDIEMVQSALDGLLQEPPDQRVAERGKPTLWVDALSERDYLTEPKPSGYRAWHCSLGVLVQAGQKWIPVRCELQVRTLLQDGWGELTHEDTYTKDGELPPLVEVLSKRMADLLSTLDDIAEDLRSELDRIDQAAVAEHPGATTHSGATTHPASTSGGNEQAVDAADLLLDRWRNLDRPTDLASFAWELQREFGAEITDGWFGHGSFKAFLVSAVPEGEISTGRQAYLLPPTASDAEPEPEIRDVPAAALALRRVDGSFPLLGPEQWLRVYEELAESWRRIGAMPTRDGNLSTKSVNQLTRSARDRSKSSGSPVARRHLDYLAKAVLPASPNGAPLNAAEIGDLFSTLTIQRMVDLRILKSRAGNEHAAVAAWLAA